MNLETHPACQPDSQLSSDCDIRFAKRSGPGGQHRNKVETAVIVTHRPSGISAEANERRSQQANREVALQRLRLKLATDIQFDCGGELPATTQRWRQRASRGRLAINDRHADFPALLAEALTVIMVCKQMSVAANHLQISSSQLIKLLKKYPPALNRVNEMRQASGLSRLR